MCVTCIIISTAVLLFTLQPQYIFLFIYYNQFVLLQKLFGIQRNNNERKHGIANINPFES